MPSNDPNYQKEYIRKHYMENKQYYINKSKQRRIKMSLEKRLYEGVRDRAKRNNIPFNIEISDIVIPEKCPVLDTVFDQENVYTRASVDRVNPKLGYIKGNINVISHRANWLKSNSSLQEIEKLYNWMKTLSS